MNLWTITIPLALNDGTPTEQSLFDRAELVLLDCAGGFTDGYVRGGFREDGVVYRDRSVRYEVLMPHTFGNERAMFELARTVARDANQVSVLVTNLGADGIKAYFIKADQDFGTID